MAVSLTGRIISSLTSSSSSSVNHGAANMVSTITSALTRGGAKKPEKVKLRDKFRLFWVSLYQDYRDVFFEAVADCKKNPRKSTIYFSLLGGLGYLMGTNPDDKSYWERVTRFDTEVSLVAKSVKNPRAEKYLRDIRRMEMKGLLRYQNVGFFSFVWRDNDNPEAGLYHAKCNYTKPRWSEIVTERLVDVGILGKWWNLERSLVDFDINPEEWGEVERGSLLSLFTPVVKADSLLRISWHDSAWIPILNGGNVLDYFSERSNPFYDRTCNNEIIRMQRLSMDQLANMTGLEFILLHVQEPILYVIRKQHRHGPQQTTPIADYYIIAGVVYQSPDLGSVVNSRLLNTVHHLQIAFDEVVSYSRYQPSKGYWWEFKDKQDPADKTTKKDKKEEPSSIFQRQRVDMLLMELSKKFPPKQLQIEGPPPSNSKPQQASNNNDSGRPAEGQNADVKPDIAQVPIKTEKEQNPQQMKPPPEKRQKLT